MAGRRMIPLLSTVFLLMAGTVVSPVFGDVSKLPSGDLVMGTVERVDGDLLTVDGVSYDTRNVRVQFMTGMNPVEKPLLRGMRVEILITNGKIRSVHVFPVKGG